MSESEENRKGEERTWTNVINVEKEHNATPNMRFCSQHKF